MFYQYYMTAYKYQKKTYGGNLLKKKLGKPNMSGRPKAIFKGKPLRRTGSVFAPQGNVKKRVAPIMRRKKK